MDDLKNLEPEADSVMEVSAAAPEAPAPTGKPITQEDHVPPGVGGEFVLLPNGIRVTAARYEESLK
jgi:hypothetical protein